MGRLDKTYAELKNKLSDSSLSQEELQEVSQKLAARERALLPIYQQISVQFADLHDRSGRMLAKGAIRKELELVDARRFFFWRIRRRLNEEYLIKRIGEVLEKATRVEKVARLRSWYPASVDFEDDRVIANWIEDNRETLDSLVKQLKDEAFAQNIALLIRTNHDSAISGLAEVFGLLSPEDKEKILKGSN
jgi:acetyl-CoA carboxylase/biotin carboxylase 1